MATTRAAAGSARTQGELWGARARDWAQLQEPKHRVLYEQAMRRTALAPGSAVLDVGCGSGLFCRLATDAGARVAGIDAAEPLIEIARELVPEGDFRIGDLQFLPYQADRFDLVTGFNSFQYAADAGTALAEARRVAKRGGRVLALVWGRPERTELAALLEALRPLLPPPAPDARGPFALSYEGALEALARGAGLTPDDGDYLEATFEYPDQDALVRASLSSGPAVLAARTSGEQAVRDAVLAGLAPFRTRRGAYRIETEWRCLTAKA